MKALLALENGFTLEGTSFTGEFETGGEVIFNTGMGGYQELLTDPSYCGQLVCLTYPQIGNYGIAQGDNESKGIHMRALLVKECCKEPSNWRSIMSLPEFMKQYGVPGMEGLDTRALAIEVRRHGAMRGMISTQDLDRESLVRKARALPTMEGQNLVPFVCAK
ncbi:MAG: carbamoyl phosphate synthase small subunit, partial [Desulfovibrio sp.]|nr:carbamoyl phosphate synthase small subunit [Desulfovibrio sp.]